MSEVKETTSASVKTVSQAKNSKKSQEVRDAQAVGNVKLNERREYVLVKGNAHYAKGDKVALIAPTAEVFRAKGLIGKDDEGSEIKKPVRKKDRKVQ